MPSFVDNQGIRVAAGEETLRTLLRTLAAPIDQPGGAADALRELADDQLRRRLEPVHVLWNRRPGRIVLGMPPRGRTSGRVDVVIRLEDGADRTASHAPRDLEPRRQRTPDGRDHPALAIPLPALPFGYHRLVVTHAGDEREALLVSAPSISWQDDDPDARHLGIFCPLYAIRSSRNSGCGDLTDLRTLHAFGAAHGATVISTLPLLSVFLDDSPLHAPEPYNPVSRLFWNELFLDVQRTEVFEHAPEAQRIAASADYRAVRQRLQRTKLVDYAGAGALQRRLLDAAAHAFFERGDDRAAAYRDFARRHPLLERYVAFRAACERRGTPWREWPRAMRDGRLGRAAGDEAVRRRHRFAQFALDRQLRAMADEIDASGGRLYLDLAVGVNPSGFDVWQHADLFATGAVVGAPTEPAIPDGQIWGFPPLHPTRIREAGYRYTIASLRSQMQFAGALRLDHVMAYHRLFLIPDGRPASEGAYVRYADRELFAILCLESHRNRCRLIGENLGMVPPAIDRALEKHRIGGLYVAQCDIGTDARSTLQQETAGTAASVNTHDFPPFASFVLGEDMQVRRVIDGLDPEPPADATAHRRKQIAAMTRALRLNGIASTVTPRPSLLLRALLERLARSDAELVLVNIEDLWEETRAQNVPGTYEEHPNWRHKLARSLRSITRDPEIAALLEDLAKLRQQPR